MSSNYEEAVAEFLSQKENLRFALEIARHLGAARQSLVVSFWNMVEEKLRSELFPESKIGWLLEVDRDMGARYPGINIVPPGAPNARFVYRLSRDINFFNSILVQGSGDIQTSERENPRFQKAVNLAKDMKWFVKDHDRQSIGWSHCGLIFDNQDDMLIEMAENTETLCAGIVKKAVKDFRTVGSVILELNDLGGG